MDEATLLQALSAAGPPKCYAEIARTLDLPWDDSMRAALSAKIGRLVRQGKVVQVSRYDLRQQGVDLADYEPHTKFWARAQEGAPPIDPVLRGGSSQELTPLGVILEARALASGLRKTHFLANHRIDPRTWWRLITPGQNPPRRETVIKYAERVGANVAEALRAAGFGEGSAPTPGLSELGKVLERARFAFQPDKQAFLAETGVGSREWYRLTTEGQERPQAHTVVKFARLARADVAEALEAAGYDRRLAPPPVTDDPPRDGGV